MSQSDNFRFAAISAVKHEYVPIGVAEHPRFDPVVVADDPDQAEWVHERNEILAGQLGVPYVRDVDRALTEYGAEVAVVSSQAERHCDLSVRAADAGLHVVQDKPMSTQGLRVRPRGGGRRTEQRQVHDVEPQRLADRAPGRGRNQPRLHRRSLLSPRRLLLRVGRGASQGLPQAGRPRDRLGAVPAVGTRTRDATAGWG